MDKQLMSALISRACDALIRTAESVPEDKLTWRPLEQGRSVLELLEEAARMPDAIVQFLEPGAEPEALQAIYIRMKKQPQGWTRAQSLQALRENSASLLSVLDGLNDEELRRSLTVPIGPGGSMTQPVAGWIMMTYRSCVSRFAQINYIQTLYGDFEMH